MPFEREREESEARVRGERKRVRVIYVLSYGAVDGRSLSRRSPPLSVSCRSKSGERRDVGDAQAEGECDAEGCRYPTLYPS